MSLGGMLKDRGVLGGVGRGVVVDLDLEGTSLLEFRDR